MRIDLWLVIGLLVAVTQTACSKSSADNGASSGGGAATANNWDSMVWNQGTWQ